MFTRLLALLISLCTLSSCYSLQLQYRGDGVALVSGEPLQPGPYRVIRHLYKEQELHYIFGFPLEGSRANLVGELLRTELSPQQEIVNLRFKRHVKPINQLNTLLTLGIYLRVHLVLEGDIIERTP